MFDTEPLVAGEKEEKMFTNPSTHLRASTRTLTQELLLQMDAYWRAANYLAVGQIYLCDNPLLKRPLRLADIKHILLGHWGTTPGQNFIYVHLNVSGL
jgi:phosphoketolase